MILEAVVAAFVLTQFAYFFANCGLLTLLVRRPTSVVDDATVERIVADWESTSNPDRSPIQSDGGPRSNSGVRSDSGSQPLGGGRPAAASGCRLPDSRLRRVRVLIPIYRERWETLQETLANIEAQRYPTDCVSVYIIHEETDPNVSALHSEAISPREDGLSVEFVQVDRDALAANRAPGEWCFDGMGVPRTKAAALTYAFTTLSFAADDIVTVFDSDTQMPLDTFELAVAGLEEYGIVQAKQTARNIDDGFLPLLESMGIAAWSDLIYANSSDRPYQLLGKAYFTEASVLYDLDRWQLDSVTEDMDLGIAAHERGYTLGIVDRYVQDLCPSTLEAWVRQKRRWVRGPYRHLLTPGWSGVERGQFWAGTVMTQLLSVTNIVGVPAGIAVLAVTIAGSKGTVVPAFLAPIVLFNAACWSYYGWQSYRAAWDAVPFESRWHGIRYSLLSNPFTQSLYAALWAVPICLAIVEVVRGIAPTFSVTPKR